MDCEAVSDGYSADPGEVDKRYVTLMFWLIFHVRIFFKRCLVNTLSEWQ